MNTNELIVIGDRVLIAPDTSKEKTASGLYLPQGVREKEKVQSGRVVAVGPGYAVPAHSDTADSEPWMNTGRDAEPKYIPLQVNEGDYAIFLKRETVEIEYNGTAYLIIPQAGILAVVRNESADLPAGL